jgi:hypothetical protein
MILHNVYNGSNMCEGDVYFNFTTRFAACYFPTAYDGMPQQDVYDEILTWDKMGRPTKYRRSYYYSTDGSCQSLVEGAGYEDGFSSWCFGWVMADSTAGSVSESLYI